VAESIAWSGSGTFASVSRNPQRRGKAYLMVVKKKAVTNPFA
jgi:hypothetical protein